jgi:hypothetical protein
VEHSKQKPVVHRFRNEASQFQHSQTPARFIHYNE